MSRPLLGPNLITLLFTFGFPRDQCGGSGFVTTLKFTLTLGSDRLWASKELPPSVWPNFTHHPQHFLNPTHWWVPRFLLRPSSITFNPVHIFLYAVLDVSIKDGETFDLLHLPIHLLRGNNLEDAAELRQSAVLLRVHLLQLGSQLQALVSKSSSNKLLLLG